jgi:NAD(P)-dependent dehydrogenase (short-subunit alcohol dehydrogenase family)
MARRIVVVGAGSGIGAATAAHFHNLGDHVLAVDVRASETPASQHLQCDLQDAHSVGELLAQVGGGWDSSLMSPAFPGPRPPRMC